MFALARLWDAWTDDRTGLVVESCTIITTEANARLETVPHDRMPVVLRREDWGRWLDPATIDIVVVQPLIRPFDAEAMQLHVVDAQYVNYGVDDERCIAALAA